MRLVPVRSHDIGAHWEWLKPRLELAIRKSGERHHVDAIWTPLRSGMLYLYLVEHGGEPIGFFLFEQRLDPDGLCLFVFATWLERGAGKVWREQLVNELRAIKDACGAKRIAWKGRKGWGKVGRVVSYNYEME